MGLLEKSLTPLIVVSSILLGLGAVLVLPREEEPQIVVPMIDVFVQMPGASAKEVQERVTKPMEKLIWEIPGVEYIYSTSSPGFAMAVVRFYVGEDEEKSIVRLNQKMFANFDLIPPGASPPLIKPRYIDDVPILALTLWSHRYDHYTLRRIAAQLDDVIKAVDNVSSTTLIGGQRRQVRITLEPARMSAYSISPLAAGSFAQVNREFLVEAGGFFQNSKDVENLVISTFNQRPVYLRNIAQVTDGPEEPSQYVFFGTRCASERDSTPGGYLQRFPGGHAGCSQTQGNQCRSGGRRGFGKSECLQGNTDSQRCGTDYYAALRRDGFGKIQGAASPYGNCRAFGDPADLADPGSA